MQSHIIEGGSRVCRGKHRPHPTIRLGYMAGVIAVMPIVEGKQDKQSKTSTKIGETRASNNHI